MTSEQWYFTFGARQEFEGYYVVIPGSFADARVRMVQKYGIAWSGQYTAQQFEQLGLGDKLECLEVFEVWAG